MRGLSVRRTIWVCVGLSALLATQLTSVSATGRAGASGAMGGRRASAAATLFGNRVSNFASPSPALSEGSRFIPVQPRRIMDTRTGAGGVGIGPAPARSTVSFPVAGVAGTPRSGVTAVVLHLTAIRPARSGVLVAFPSGATRPNVVSASFTAGESVTSLVLVRPGAVRRASVYNGSAGPTHLRADAIGYFAPAASAPAGSVQVFVPPRRIMDTRNGVGGVPERPVPARGTVTFPVAGVAGVPDSGVTAVLLQLTAIRPASSGSLVGFPTGTTRPGIVSASFTSEETVTATVVIKPGTRRRASLYNRSAGAIHLRADVIGYFAVPTDPLTGSALLPVTARRIMDTRTGAGGVPRRPVPARSSVSFPIVGVAGVPKSRVTGVLVHLTAIRPSGSGALVAFPARSLRRPSIVSASFMAGEIVTGTVLLRPGAAGRATVYNGSAGRVHLRADVVGYLRAIPAGWTARMSIDGNGTEANGGSGRPSLSGDGRYVAFESTASNLVKGENNGKQHVFLHGRVNGATILVSRASNGDQADSDSYAGSVSANGRYVAFYTGASNLVAGDTGNWDVFLHDPDTGETTRVSVASDGREANGGSSGGSVSADGRYVAFLSDASNLVAGDTNSTTDVFVHDQVIGTTTRVNVASDGTEANDRSQYLPVVSADGRYVTFTSMASNLVAGDTNSAEDVFVHDRVGGTTTRVSIASDGTEANGSSFASSLSADGRYVVFTSEASNLVPDDTDASQWNVFVHDRATRLTSRVNVASDGTEARGGDGDSGGGSLSADGRYVAFHSDATNLAPGDIVEFNHYVYVHDRTSGMTTRVSVATDGTLPANSFGFGGSISADGRYVAFSSGTSNLVAGDTNNVSDVFIRDRQ
jgi:Tol biopolymer transport system component